eukprot:6205783-Pleurochrysis_carterae.AAC.1
MQDSLLFAQEGSSPRTDASTLYFVKIESDSTDSAQLISVAAAETLDGSPYFTYVKSDAVPSTRYAVQILAQNSAGVSRFSTQITVITPSVPSPPPPPPSPPSRPPTLPPSTPAPPTSPPSSPPLPPQTPFPSPPPPSPPPPTSPIVIVPPTEPTDLRLADTIPGLNNKSYVHIAWSAPKSDGGQPLVAYTVAVRVAGYPTQEFVIGAQPRSFVLARYAPFGSTLRPAITYSLRVGARNSEFAGNLSGELL